MTETMHLGKKISRIRELRGMKQETLAEQLGISQQAVSKIEQSETVDETTLDRVAKALGFTKEAIMKYNDESVLNMIQNNTFHDDSAPVFNFQCAVNPFDEIMRLNTEKDDLYKALLKEKDEKLALLEKVIAKLEAR